MLKFSRYIVEQEAPRSGSVLSSGQRAPTEEDLKKALEALKDYPEDQRGALEQQIRQAYEQQKASAEATGQAAAADKALGTLPKEGLLDVAARSLGIQAGPVVPGVDAYKDQADTPEKEERHNKARDYFYGTSIGNVQSQKKLKELLGRSTFTGENVTIDDVKKAGLDPDEVWKSVDPGTYYANAPLEQQMQAASAGSREARFALGGIAAGVEGLNIAQEGLPGFAAGVAGVGAALGRAPAPAPAGAAVKPVQQPAKPAEPFAPSLGPGVRGSVAGGKPTTRTPGRLTTALANILVAVNATNAAARPVSPTPQQGIVQTTPGTPAPGGATTPTTPAAPASTARPAAATQTPSGPAAPSGGGVQTGAKAPALAPVIPPVAQTAPAPAPAPTKAPAEAPREISPVPQKGIQIGDIVPAVGMVQAAKDAVQKSIEDAKKDATGQEAPSTAEDKAKAEAEAKAETKAETPQKADQWWKDQAKDQAPAEAPAQAPAQQPARVPAPVKQPTPGETPGGVRPGRVTPPTPRTPTPPPPVPAPFTSAPKKKQAEKEEPSPSGGSGVGQMFISGLATTTKEAEPIIKSFKFRKESISPEILIQRARLSMINEVLFSLIERKEDEEEYVPAEDEDSCGEGPMGGNAGMFVSAQEQPPEPEVPEIKFKKSRA